MLDAVASSNAKQAGMQLALDVQDDWKDRVLAELSAWISNQVAKGATEMTIEQFRAGAIHRPTSPKAWGPLAVLACKAGLIAPMTHPDGSPVYRLAESVKTHRHPVRAYRFASSFFPAPAGAQAPRLHDRAPAEPERQPQEIARVGDAASAIAGAGS